MIRIRRPNIIASFQLDSPYATEARRMLQTLGRRARDTGRKTYLITSAGRSEGKSTTAAVLAVVSARVFRKRTLLIDGDIRRPAQHHLLGISHRPGLCELMQNQVPVEVAIRATPVPLLFAIPSGHAMGPLVEAYDDERFHSLMERFAGEFDLVFVDSAPVVPVVEPLLMAEHVHGILLVAMAGRSPLALIRRLREILQPLESKIAGVILNNATEGLPYYYDHRYYGYEPERGHPTRTRREGNASPGGRERSAPPEPHGRNNG